MINLRFNTSCFATNRLIYQQNTPKENIQQSADPKLTAVTRTVEKSYLDRLAMMKNLDQQLEPIATQRKQHRELLLNLKQQLASHPEQTTVQGTLECFGKTILVIMSSNGEYQEYLDQQPINFLNWAIANQKEQL